MNNPNKKIVLYHNATNRRSSFTEQEFKAFQQHAHSKEWISQGYEIPEGAARCWYVSEDERKAAVKENRRYRTDFSPTEYFKITSRVDSSFVEGHLGYTEAKKYFFGTIDTNYQFFKDFNLGHPVYFTFDNIALFKVMEIFTTNPLKFLLKRVDNTRPVIKDKIFMIMPFGGKGLNSFYKKNIEKFLKSKMNIDVIRADSFLDNDVIINTIYKQIEESEIIIADITNDNKNCFYELGYASAIGKEIIAIQHITPKGSFFDRSHIRYISYDFDDEIQFQTQLEGTILSIRNRQ